jgi:hypothetical protein
LSLSSEDNGLGSENRIRLEVRWRNFPLAQIIFKVTNDDADTHSREYHVIEKANSTERGGRKVSGLQPDGQGSGTAEVSGKEAQEQYCKR